MGHHFDSPSAAEDPRLDPTDFFVFPGEDGASTVFVLNVNPDAGAKAAAEFRPEALYEVKIDLDGDATEDLAVRATFGPSTSDPAAAAAFGNDRSQPFTVAVARGEQAREGVDGEVLASGRTEQVLPLGGGGRAWAGKAAEPFFANFFAHGAFIGGLVGDGAFRPQVFADPALHEGQPRNTFAERNVMSLVIEIPNAVLGDVEIGAWAAISLYGHAPQQQVSRMANPVIVFYFGAGVDPEKLTWLRGHPRDDRARFADTAAAFVAKTAAAAGRTADPAGYGRKVAALLLPDMLRYRVGTAASYGFAGRNGRALTDDVLDLQLATITNAPIDDGLTSPGRVRPAFPYVGEPSARRHDESLYDATH